MLKLFMLLDMLNWADGRQLDKAGSTFRQGFVPQELNSVTCSGQPELLPLHVVCS